MEHGIFDADMISFKLECGIEALCAVHTAMESGPNRPEGYLNALYAVYDYLYDQQKELDKAIQYDLRKRREQHE